MQDVTKRYGRTTAVDRLSFTVRPGRVTGFLGPNGSGKSTTMRVVMGLDRPQTGRATIAGRPYVQLAHPLREVGALLDAKQAHPGHSAAQHLRWVAASAGLPRSRVDEVLAMVGLTDVAGRKVGGFSLGMHQRLGIATALLGDPPVLLFDEPVNGLDPEGILWVRNLMKYLAAQGRTVLVSSHLLAEMALTADHLVIIGRGRLIADVATREFVQQGATASVRVRSPQAARLRTALAGTRAVVDEASGDGVVVVRGLDTAAVGELAFANGIPLHELTEVTASLEEAFLALTEGHAEFSAGSPATVGPVRS